RTCIAAARNSSPSCSALVRRPRRSRRTGHSPTEAASFLSKSFPAVSQPYVRAPHNGTPATTRLGWAGDNMGEPDKAKIIFVIFRRPDLTHEQSMAEWIG